MWHVWGDKEMHAELWLGNLKERNHVEDLGVDGSMIIKWTLYKWDVRWWSRFISLRMGSSAGPVNVVMDFCVL
jgi:hypothetical protein